MPGLVAGFSYHTQNNLQNVTGWGDTRNFHDGNVCCFIVIHAHINDYKWLL
jgi:hypothetical protein